MLEGQAGGHLEEALDQIQGEGREGRAEAGQELEGLAGGHREEALYQVQGEGSEGRAEAGQELEGRLD